MRNMKLRLFFAAATILSLAALIQACSKSSPSPAKNSGFDRVGMLTNISTNIIVPGYLTFQTSVNALNAAETDFNTAPDAAKLATLQSAFIDAYKKWQSVSVFDLGPASNENLRISLNTFPADVNQINTNVSTGSYNLSSLSSLDVQGFPALDYLLFGTGADNAAILIQYTSDAAATNRKAYLAAVMGIIKTKTDNVVAAWTSTYPATFLSAAGTDVGSSLGQLTNQLNEDYETLKNYEIGIPAGTESMGTVFPQKVQAYYSKISLQLALLHLQAIQNVYEGISTKGNGLSFDDYLVSLNAKYNGGSLNDAIITQFAASQNKLQALSDPLSAQITSNVTGVNAAYTALQLQTVLLKTDMPSALGVSITYGDTDGD
jgi:predicted lipoprotein